MNNKFIQPEQSEQFLKEERQKLKMEKALGRTKYEDFLKPFIGQSKGFGIVFDPKDFPDVDVRTIATYPRKIMKDLIKPVQISKISGGRFFIFIK